MGDLEADLENLASEISCKDDVLGLDVDLQYNSPQFNRLSPLDAQYMGGSPWSRGFEAERINRLTPRLSASSPGGSPFLRIKSGSSSSPDLLASFLKSEGGDSPLTRHRQVALHNTMNSGRLSPNLSSPILPRQNSSGRVPGADPTPQHPDRQRKPILMLPPRSSVPVTPTPQILEPESVTNSPLAMKRSKKVLPIPQTSRQRIAIPTTSPTLPRRAAEVIPQIRRPTPAPPYYLPEGGSISPARLQAALCSLQSAALDQLAPAPAHPTSSSWPGYMLERPLFEDPTLASSRELQNLALRDRIPDRLPELTSPLMAHGSPFVDRSRTREPIAREKVTREKVTREKIMHEHVTTTAVLVTGSSPGDKKDRLRRRREIHSAVERRRRDITNNVLNQLAVLVTTKNMPESKMYKSEILQHSVKHILHSHDVLREFANELRRLHPTNHVLAKYQTFLEGLVTEADVMQNAPATIR